jgi:hypothetical protein
MVVNMGKIFSALYGPRMHQRIHKSPALDVTSSQLNPVHILPAYSLNAHLNRSVIL